MSVVKITNKESLETLQAKLTLRLGRKLTQQETLDICIKSGLDNIDKLINYVQKQPKVNKEKALLIVRNREKLNDVPYDLDLENVSEDDKDIYT